jgi:hypothetical protein
MPPGGAICSSRAAILTPSPNTSPFSTIPEFEAVAGWDVLIALCHSALHRDGTRNRLNYRRKPEQQAVAGGLDDMSLVGGNEWIDQLFAMAFQRQVSALFIYAHETRVARHVGGDDRGKATI